MSSFNLVQWGALGAGLAGVAWIVAGVIPSAIPSVTVGQNLLPVLAIYALALIGVIVGLFGLYARQARSLGWLGTTGFLAAFLGSGLALVAIVLILLSSGDLLARELGAQALGLGLTGILLGFVVSSVGVVLLGVGTLLARALPLWCGVALIALPFSAAVNDYGGWIVFGLLWLALGYVLWSERGEVDRRLTRASGASEDDQ
jgi:hypothetical protein